MSRASLNQAALPGFSFSAIGKHAAEGAGAARRWLSVPGSVALFAVLALSSACSKSEVTPSSAPNSSAAASSAGGPNSPSKQAPAQEEPASATAAATAAKPEAAADAKAGTSPGSSARVNNPSAKLVVENGVNNPALPAPKSAAAKPVTEKPAAAASVAQATPEPAPAAPSVAAASITPCKATSFKFQSVADACAKGGVKQAKSMMKALVNKAKANGQSVKCTSCHSDSVSYGLKDNAVADFRELMKVQ